MEWFMAFDHLPADSASPAWAMGDGSLSLVDAASIQSVDEEHRLRSFVTASPEWAWARSVPDLTRIVVGYRWRPIGDGSTNSSSSMPLYFLHGASLGINVHREAGAAGSWSLRVGTTVVDSAIFTDLANIDYYIEVSAIIDGTNGEVTVKIDGEVVGEYAGDTGSSPVTEVRGGGRIGRGTSSTFGSSGGAVFSSAIYVRERPEGQLGFYGPLSFRRIDPTSDITTDWTPDSGLENFSRVAGVAATASYVESDTLAATDEYGMDDLPSGVNSIIAVVRYSVSEAPEGGAPQIAQGLKRGTTEKYVTDPERTVGVGGPRTQLTPHLTQPNGSPWSTAAVDEINSLLKAV
jgi:hypothetical protein